MDTPVYRPETYEADMALAARDLLAHAVSVAEEDLGGECDTPAGEALADAYEATDAATTAAFGPCDAAGPMGGADDPVRSVRAAIALLWMADADGPGEGWGDVAESLERRLWARGPVVDTDTDTDTDTDDARRRGPCAEPGCIRMDHRHLGGAHCDASLTEWE